jgi:uncharacterized membrane protein
VKQRRRFFPVPFLQLIVGTAGILPWTFIIARSRPPALIGLFHSFCHQLPERTLTLFGTPMLVCSRCAGIYAGIALGALLPAPPFPVRWGRCVVMVAATMMLLDVLAQNLGIYPVLHATRILTGLAAGWSVSALMFAYLRRESFQESGTSGRET